MNNVDPNDASTGYEKSEKLGDGRRMARCKDCVGTFGTSRVGTFGSSRVGTFGSSRVGTFGSFRVGTFDSYRVGTFGSSRVGACVGICFVTCESQVVSRDLQAVMS